MRYFYIAFSHYQHIDDSTVFGDGWLTLETEGTYPSREAILRDIQEKDKEVQNITILNIIELNELDFKDFTGE